MRLLKKLTYIDVKFVFGFFCIVVLICEAREQNTDVLFSELAPPIPSGLIAGNQIFAGTVEVSAGIFLALGSDEYINRSDRKPIFDAEDHLRELDTHIQMFAFLFGPLEYDGCSRRVIKAYHEILSNRYVPFLPQHPRGTTRFLVKWGRERSAAQRAFDEAKRVYGNRVRFGYLMRIAGGALIAQIGTRLWVFHVYDADPGVLPNATLAYHFGVKAPLQMIGFFEPMVSDISLENEKTRIE